MLYIFMILYVIFFILNSYIYKKKINFSNLILTIWTTTSVLSMFGFYGMYVPNNEAYLYILCFLIAFEFLSLLFYKTLKVKKKEEQPEDEVNYKRINIILIVLICVMAYFSIEGIKILLSGGSFSDVRDSYLNYENFSNQLQMFVSLVVVPMGYAIGVYAIIDYIDRKKIALTHILFLVFLGEVIIYTGGRGAIVYFALILIIALMDKYNNNIIKIIKENKLIILGLIIIAIILGVITLQRNLRGKGIIYNIYCYFVGSVHLFGVYVDNPERYLLTNENLLFGQILISGLSYPILFILDFFGSNVKAGLYVLYEVTQKYVQISPDTTINNSVTMLCYALRDFGWLRNIYL